ncbi:interferon-induced protein 44-like [Brienomyrus brachyistius]|uniref:interferon-induced protein 44-like n=1 Tax=Brienomyrus brachyistius TaxID=42636 RepID=UPI0020B21412|nr:interferon-induced protein 44-like [Brienomyrus brachyistius]
MDSSSPGFLHPDTKKKVDQIREDCRLQKVPLVVLLTKVDKACPHVEKDLKNVYRSYYIRDLIKKASGCLGIAELNVLPVQNYSHEIELNDACDILLLTAMKQMLNFADNYLDNFD